MKLEVREDSKNYACTVVKLPPKQKVEGLDKLVKVTVFGNDVLTQKDTDEQQLYLFFPAECQISSSYLSVNNEFRESQLNNDTNKKGYFEPSGRVKAIKFKGIISTGYLAPVSTLDALLKKPLWLKEGLEFTDIDGVNICKKYIIKYEQGERQSKESRYNKKLQRFDKLVPNQFRFHTDTSQLARNLHVFNPEDIIVITDKWHGTSAVFANVLINKTLTWKEKLAKWLGIDVVTTKYDDLYSSRSVIKNRYINKEATEGFYGEDIWAVVHNEIKSKIESGISLYGEIVGYLPSGKMIQKDYDYGCNNFKCGDIVYKPSGKPFKEGFMEDEIIEMTINSKDPKNRIAAKLKNSNTVVSLDMLEKKSKDHKFLVYRITYTKPDGNVIEFSWQQIKNYCQKYQLEHVKEIFYGPGQMLAQLTTTEEWREKLFNNLSKYYLEKDCTYCVNKVPAEGIVVRRDGLENYSAYKLKSKRFLERETKELDKGEVNIEDDATVSDL